MPSSNLYRQCSQLPLDRFITCIVDGDLTALVISGSADSEELAEVWGEIYLEYVELSDDNHTRFLSLLQRDISLLYDEVSTIETCLYLLQPAMAPFISEYSDEIHDILKKYGYHIKIDFTKDYSKKLKQIEGRLALSKIGLEGKEKEFMSHIEGSQGGSINRDHFTKILWRLSKYQGYPVRAKEITVEEYVSLVKDYTAYAENQNNKGGQDGQ